jgi:YggT family protein
MIYLIAILSWFLRAMEFVIVIWALLSWLPGAQRSGFGVLINRIASIIIDPIRRVMPRTGMIDFSPLVALLLLYLAQMGIAGLAQMF